MKLIKNYNIIDALIEYRKALIINILVGVFVILFNNYKMVGLYYFATGVIFFIYTFVVNYFKSKIVLNYVVNYEYHIIEKYQLNTGFGYKADFRNLNEEDIYKLLNSRVKNEFIDCYHIVSKILYPLVIMMIEYFVMIKLMEFVFRSG